MRKWMAILAACVLLVGSVSALAERTEPEHQAVLYADFSCGNPTPEALNLISQFELGYDGELTVPVLATGLSNLSGLDFTINQAEALEDGYLVDWAKESTLVAGLDDRTQKEDFFFYDVDSLNWFMMDSLARTIKENLGAQSVYYTMDGGNELSLPSMSGMSWFPKDQPYLGSAVYTGNEQEEIHYPMFVAANELETQRGEERYDVDGQYKIQQITGDGIVVVENLGFPCIEPPDDAERYLTELVGQISGEDMPFEIRVFEDKGFTGKLSFPCYLAQWYTGGNEDTRQNIALFALTDTVTLCYRFSVSADSFEGLRDRLYQTLDSVTIEER